jgi:hypothetical protein
MLMLMLIEHRIHNQRNMVWNDKHFFPMLNQIEIDRLSKRFAIKKRNIFIRLKLFNKLNELVLENFYYNQIARHEFEVFH